MRGGRGRWQAAGAAALAALAAAGAAQAPPRRATNLAALLAFPAFYHGRQVTIVGTVATEDNGTIRVTDGLASLRVVFRGGAPDGNAEIRGEFWDVGRMKPDDPRLASLDIKRALGVDPEGPWPRPGEVAALVASTIIPAAVPSAPSIRSIVLNPSRYLNQRVTVTGQYAGRNLLGDLPDAPARSRWDFVIDSTDAAIWVSGARPKGKGFDLALDARIDTGRWLEVTGIVREGRGLQWIEAAVDGVRQGTPLVEQAEATEEAPARPAPAPPPEVLFSVPAQDETDIPLNTSVRIQFSRDIDPATFTGNIRASYLESESIERGEPTTPQAEFTTRYNAGTRVLELVFSKPLERFRTLRIELTGGIRGTDEQPLKPWVLTFVLGAS